MMVENQQPCKGFSLQAENLSDGKISVIFILQRTSLVIYVIADGDDWGDFSIPT